MSEEKDVYMLFVATQNINRDRDKISKELKVCKVHKVKNLQSKFFQKTFIIVVDNSPWPEALNNTDIFN